MRQSWIRESLSFLAVVLGTTQLSAAEPGRQVIHLDQGWSQQQREQYYHVEYGSELIPYRWFVALEQPDNPSLFIEAAHMRRFGYVVPSPHVQSNPDGLPLGFVKNENPAPLETWLPFLSSGITRSQFDRRIRQLSDSDGLKRNADGLPAYPEIKTVDVTKESLGGEFAEDFAAKGPSLGFNCFACHSVEITHRGTVLRIDGAGSLCDHAAFMQALTQAVDATLQDDAKFKRFAKRTLGKQDAGNPQTRLRRQVSVFAQGLRGLAARTYQQSHPNGFGRLDAFGTLFNEIAGTAINVPQNYRIANAPTNIPFLWGVPQLDWFQTNAFANNPMIRNVAEALFCAPAAVSSDCEKLKFDSAANVNNLYEMWNYLAELKAPLWPEDVLGNIDDEKAKRGAAIYRREGCAECHAEKDPYPLTPANKYGKRFVKTVRVPLNKIGTDPTMAGNIVKRMGRSGQIAALVENQQEYPMAPIFGATIVGFMTAKFEAIKATPQQQVELFADRETQVPTLEELACYRARPLPGLWSTAPFLHNGSVPNLYQLLLPPDQRVKRFYVGGREYDPKHVGYEYDESEGAFLFRTEVPGNSNAGHEYGTKITDDERWDLIEYLKTL